MNKYQKIVVNMLSKNYLIGTGLRNKMLSFAGFSIGTNVRINSGYYFDSNNIIIGKNVVINHFFNFFDAGKNAKLIIEDNVFIGPNCHISAMSHEITSNSKQRAGKTFVKDVSVGSGTWIGADVKILPGVHIANGCVIGAGSVVTKDTDSNGLYVGVPAKKIKNL